MQVSYYVRPDRVVITYEAVGASASTLQMELFVADSVLPAGSMRATWLQVFNSISTVYCASVM